MKKRVLASALVGLLTLGLLAGCGATKSADSTADDNDTVTLKIAASTTPHAEILEHVKDQLAEEGVNLEITEFEDYVQPNLVVDQGEYDANYFQHITYLNNFNEENNTDLVSAGEIHYEPFGIYGGTKTDLADISDGDKIAVPNDTTNEARALLLLQANGIIKLADGVGLEATVNDIVENPNNVEIEELEPAQVSRVVNECAYVVLNGNYAQEAGLSVGKDALAVEEQNSEAAENYVNVIAVKKGNEDNEAIQKLVKVLKSDEVKQWIEEEYDGAVVPYEG
ncbi:MAG: MetQ/NlpA family ABC transporter substrate-binding protein [Lachnospiraceae bacterium]|nr:MetQ/NlpA family ABC transporter substrate-binding protein [Lachnospiraceae bacterium]